MFWLLQLPEMPGNGSGPLEWLKWLAIVGPLLFSGYVLVRSRTASIWKGERDAALAKAERLDEENKALKAAIADNEKELTEYRAKTDLSALMGQQRDFQTALNEQSQRFHTELLSALTMVASANDGRFERSQAASEKAERRAEDLYVAVMARLDAQTSTLNLINDSLARLADGDRT